MSRHLSSRLVHLGLLGNAALFVAASLSFAFEPLIAGDIASQDSPAIDVKSSTEVTVSFDDRARDRLALLTGVPLTPNAPQSTAAAQRSSRRFTLVGTVVSDWRAVRCQLADADGDCAASTAVLFDALARQTLIVHKDDVLDDAVVEAINPRQVILRRGSELEVIDARAPENDAIATEQPQTIREISPDRVAVPRAMIESSIQNLHGLAHQAFFAPTLIDGKAAFRIDRIRPNSIFKQLGLRNGDVLVAIDDIPLHRFDLLADRHRNLGRSAQVQLQFMRDGQIQRRTYEIQG